MHNGQNIYLIGMPGSGKTSLGRCLAAHLRLPFADLDQDIQARAGMSIPDIFAKRGESAFRDIESAALAAVAGRRGMVVATGGGVVLRPENRALLRDTGAVLWLDRPLSGILRTLRQDTRPLLAGDPAERLHALYEQRAALYEQTAHLRLVNTGRLPAAARRAVALLQATPNPSQATHTESEHDT
ncbi:MAG: shikimate kinase [Oscillospiraceae bacterium]|jgi:shikimate kinase|nr:shikimate kinase [Oscillospiraceae bacterium]